MATVRCIVMTAEQAAQISGPGDKADTALQPVLLTNGDYVLAINTQDNVLNDPAHEGKWALLDSFPKKYVDRGLWPKVAL